LLEVKLPAVCDCVVIIFINGLGDALLALPALRTILAESHSKSKSCLILAPEDVHSHVFLALSCYKINVQINRYDYDFIINTQQVLVQVDDFLKEYEHPMLISLNAYYPYWSIQQRLHETYKWMEVREFGNHGHWLGVKDGKKVSMMRQYLDVIQAIGKVDIEDSKPFVEYGLKQLYNQRYLALHMDSEPNKEWISREWESLILELYLSLGYNICLLGLNPRISNEFFLQNQKIFIWKQKNWAEQMQALQASDGFIGIDSCWAHAASGLRKQGIVLFGSYSDSEVWGPCSEGLEVLQADLQKLKWQDVKSKLIKILE